MKRALNIFKKSIVFILCVVMIFGASVATVPNEVVQARTIYDVERELEECKKLLKTLQSELAAIKENIESVQNQTGNTMALIEQYQAEIDALDAEIALNETIKESYAIKRSKR